MRKIQKYEYELISPYNAKINAQCEDEITLFGTIRFTYSHELVISGYIYGDIASNLGFKQIGDSMYSLKCTSNISKDEFEDFVITFVEALNESIKKVDESILTNKEEIKKSKTFNFYPDYTNTLNLGENLEEDIQEVEEVKVYNLPEEHQDEDTYCFECVSCRNKFNLNIKDLTYNEETNLYSNDDVCPICGADFGYELIGKVKNK